MKNRDWELYRKNLINLSCYVMLFFVPILCGLLILLTTGNKFNLELLSPLWNDEVGWWRQVDAVRAYGRPLGYEGYDGTHAQIGTFGPWGPTIIYPYALYGKLFLRGWNLNSLALANMFYLGMALVLFGVITKASRKHIMSMIILYTCSFITIGYSITSMSEGIRYSLGVILSALVVYYERKTKSERLINSQKDIFIFVISVLFILYAVNVYLIYSLFIPVFCWLFFRNKSVPIKLPVCIFITMIVAVVEQKGLAYFCAPYLKSSFEQFYDLYKEDGLYQMIVTIVRKVFDNLAMISPYSVIKTDDYAFGLFFLIFSFVLCASAIIMFEKRNFYDVFRVYMLAGLLLGYCVLYPTQGGWSMLRGVGSAYLFTTMILSIEEQADRKIIRYLIISMTFLGIVQIWGYYNDLIDGRKEVALYNEEILGEKQILSEIIHVSPDNDRWDNTIAYYGNCDFTYLSLPTGAGLNWMCSEGVNQDAKYVMIRNDSAKIDEYININLEAGHELIYEDEWFTILERMN